MWVFKFKTKGHARAGGTFLREIFHAGALIFTFYILRLSLWFLIILELGKIFHKSGCWVIWCCILSHIQGKFHLASNLLSSVSGFMEEREKIQPLTSTRYFSRINTLNLCFCEEECMQGSVGFSQLNSAMKLLVSSSLRILKCKARLQSGGVGLLV